MNHEYHECEQYSEEWMRLRIGKPTASSFNKIITPEGKPARGDLRLKYKYRLIAERLLNQCMDDHYESYWMRRGSELEEEALTALKKHCHNIEDIRKVGFYTAIDDKVGASPDGTIKFKNEFGEFVTDGIEIKCPAPPTHTQYLVEGPEDEYKVQMQGQMYVCRWQRIHFWSYHPNMPPVYTVFHRDHDFIVKLHNALLAFCADLDNTEAHCRGLGSFRLAELFLLSDEMETDKKRWRDKILEDM